MKFSYKFSNLFGTAYRKGNLLFTPDGNSVISPVGNRVTTFDLKNHQSRTLDLESHYNITTLGLSPDGSLLIAVNEYGQAQLISLLSCTTIRQHKFKTGVSFIAFSPDNAHFAVACENNVLVFRSPSASLGEYDPFLLQRSFVAGFGNDIAYLDWSADSRFVAVGCSDNITKVFAIRRLNNFRTYQMGQSDSIVGCYFEKDSLDLNTVDRNGQLCLWECSLATFEITEVDAPKEEKKVPKICNKKTRLNVSENEIDSEDDIEDTIKESDNKEEQTKDENDIECPKAKERHPFYYKRLRRHYLADDPRKENRAAILTAAHYNKNTKILVVGFSTGSFYLYELPDVSMIHSLNMSDYSISAALFNVTGDWVALASSDCGQLLVWEWQSEQYIMKQQGHSSEMTSIGYSLDGQYVASGGIDGKVKIWNTTSGFCFITFSEHTAAVTGIQFSRNKKFIASASLDGTVRAFDLIRYRNFKTFTTPSPVQFSCVAVDFSGELVVAGGQDVFEIYLWSLKSGNLLEVISGHEGPVSCVSFSQIPTSTILVSGSWDKTIKIWSNLSNHSQHETIDVLADVTSIAFSPCGENVAVATLKGNILVFNVKNAMQISSIEGRNDLGAGRSDTDVITAKKNLLGKYFSTIEYSADGDCLLAAGNSPNICIYHVKEALLLKKFKITQNRSLDGLREYMSRRDYSEFGNMALIEEREALEGGNKTLRLPGVLKGDMAARKFKPEVRTFSVKFSPTGQAFAAACTEGLFVYSVNKEIVFDPFNLTTEITPKAVRQLLAKQEYSNALTMALKLNDSNLISLVLESIPFDDIKLITAHLNDEIAHRLFQNIARSMQRTTHVEFYLQWCRCLLLSHGNKDSVFQHPALLSMHDSLSQKFDSLAKVCDFNKYTLRVLLNDVNDAPTNQLTKDV